MLFRTEERKLSNLDNVYMPHRIVGCTQTIDLMCKSANLVSVPRGDWIKLGRDLVAPRIHTVWEWNSTECKYDR